MPTTKKKTTPVVKKQNTNSDSYFDRIESEIKSNQSTLSLVLGVLIVIVIGVLLFNYFTKNNSQDTLSQNTTASPTTTADVSPDNLPGKYTVKDGDTLYLIADKYYKDGFKYPELVKANNLKDENNIEVGQVLDIPALGTDNTADASPSVMPSATPEVTSSIAATPAPAADTTMAPSTPANNTNASWGTPITTETYTVVYGDWLSTIAGRAYGDVMAYQKIAEANNISNPDLIEPGTVLKLPR